MSTDTNQPTTQTAPPYRRFNYDTGRDERRVSPQPKPLSPDGPQLPDHESDVELEPSEKRKRFAETGFDHHKGRSTASTYFSLSDVDDERLYGRLKSWNDGARDTDRQLVEGHADKMKWAEAHGHRLELPSYVIGDAKRLLTKLDGRTFGHYNDLHLAVGAALAKSYQWWSHKRQYRLAENSPFQTWRERDDFRELWTDRGRNEDEFKSAMSLVTKHIE